MGPYRYDCVRVRGQGSTTDEKHQTVKSMGKSWIEIARKRVSEEGFSYAYVAVAAHGSISTYVIMRQSARGLTRAFRGG